MGYFVCKLSKTNNKVEEWLDFFLDAVIGTATESIDISKQLTKLIESGMRKIQAPEKEKPVVVSGYYNIYLSIL